MGIEFDKYERYLDESYFAIIGLTGVGKSSFINALIKEERCPIGKRGSSKTKNIQVINFIYNGHPFFAIDTPGLDDENKNDEIIEKIKNLLNISPKIKKLLIVQKYNDVRFTNSMKESLKVFMEAFPLKNFWDHVIIINSWANPNDESFIDYLEDKPLSFLEKLNECENIKKYMYEKDINFPTKIKEYYIDSKKGKDIKKVKEEFEAIKKDIYESEIMFKNIEKSEIKKKIKQSKNKGFFIIKQFRIVTLTDFNDKKKELIEYLEELEVKPSESDFIRNEKIKEFYRFDNIRWFDVVTLGISWLIRKTKIYKIYEINYYNIDGQEVQGEKIFKRKIWE
jgi:predicted GTPase